MKILRKHYESSRITARTKVLAASIKNFGIATTRFIHNALLVKHSNTDKYENVTDLQGSIMWKIDAKPNGEEATIAKRLLTVAPFMVHLTICGEDEFNYIMQNYHRMREIVTNYDYDKKQELLYSETLEIAGKRAMRSENKDERWKILKNITDKQDDDTIK